ncbi:MAG: hypothetical protein PHV78_02280 [Patescibacteria group bacterium]|nr:hypothetical protein [Patescibacteria group bacterium]MDD5121027.1 hypothetical protein [Patescibacteria group bacterium]MDD5221612.1 hypothetical protein [Patescibacteria group bacterium]MDD5396054.1 hypothetical protein [Patescibacteria group bacterium]
MSKKTFITQKQYWTKVAADWQLKGDPSRPSRDTVRLYNKFMAEALGTSLGKKVVVMGATPEIRDMLYKYYFLNRIKVVCAEWLPEMYYGMTELVNHKIPGEKFVKTNWLKMGFPNKSIDVFIADLIFGNIIDLPSKDLLLSKMNQKLKKGGYFILRHCYVVPKNKVVNVKKHLFNISKDVLTEKRTIKQVATSFWTDLVIGSWFENKENKLSLYYYKKDIQDLKKYFSRKGLSYQARAAKLVFDYFLFLAKDHIARKFWVHYPRPIEEKLIKKYFVIKKTSFPQDYEAKISEPIYLLQKRELKK